MTEDMKKFLEAASTNAGIQAKLNQTTEDYIQALIGVAEGEGFHLTKDDIILLFSADQNHDGKLSEEEVAALKAKGSQPEELDDAELENVAGGKYTNKPGYLLKHSDCWCSFGGGGSSDRYQKTCACALAGAGELTDEGKAAAASYDISSQGSKSAPVAMYCPFVGLG